MSCIELEISSLSLPSIPGITLPSVQAGFSTPGITLCCNLNIPTFDFTLSINLGQLTQFLGPVAPVVINLLMKLLNEFNKAVRILNNLLLQLTECP